jgi:uncharacterized glyoxalase superfamily protein PhnB
MEISNQQQSQRDVSPNKKSVSEFLDIFEKEYGVRLTEAEAKQGAEVLIRLYKAVYGDVLIDVKDNNQNHGTK